MLNIQAEQRPFVPPERAGLSASLKAPVAAKTSAFHFGHSIDSSPRFWLNFILRSRCEEVSRDG
jgi:hypothetical protein